MTLADLITRTLRRIDEDTTTPIYYDRPQVVAALNSAQRMFVLLTLCLERTQTLTLDGGTVWYRLLDAFSDFLLPLRVRVTGGGKVLPKRLQDLDARNRDWQAAEGTPARYACLGFELFAVDPHPADAGTSLEVTYAACPAAVVTDADIPAIPEEDHPCLVDCAIPLLRATEGAQELQKALSYFDRFLTAAVKRAAFVRARNLAQRYDCLPPELTAADRSKLLRVAIPRMKPAMLDIPQASSGENNGR